MRHDIFPHFVNRDSRQISGLFSHIDKDRHRFWLKAGLNACAMLCEDKCIFPPGFHLECDIAFSVIEEQYAYLEQGLIAKPIHDENLTETVERKRREYANEKELYPGLYDDKRVEFVVSATNRIIDRKFQAGKTISDKWEASVDSKAGVWRSPQRLLGKSLFSEVSRIPSQLLSDGRASTWAAIRKQLPENARVAERELRAGLQHTYFGGWVEAYDLRLVKGIPHMGNDFYLHPRERVYLFPRLLAAMQALHIDDLLLTGSAEVILYLRKTVAFIGFTDCFSQLSGRLRTETDIRYAFGTAATAAKFDWAKAKEIRAAMGALDEFGYLSSEVSALDFCNKFLQQEYNLKKRTYQGDVDLAFKAVASKETTTAMKPEISLSDVILVAAAQELEFVREYFRANKYKYKTNQILTKLTGDTFEIKDLSGKRRTIGVLLAHAKGKAAMQEAVSNIFMYHTPERFIMVGMMAGIKGKCHLLDVISPAAVYDVTGVGTRNGKPVIEPVPSNMDPVLLHWLSQYDWSAKPLRHLVKRSKLITHKKTLTVPAKWEDMAHDICIEARKVDDENIIGLEMEASALSEKQLNQLMGNRSSQFIMIKGVADYAGEMPDEDEIKRLPSKISKIAKNSSLDPINNHELRKELQRDATRRSLEVALRLLEECPIQLAQ